MSPNVPVGDEVYPVLIVDDRPELRLMIRTRLQLCPDIEVVGEASNGEEAIALAAILAPAAVILDLDMPVMRGDEAIPDIREKAPGVRILLFSAADQSTLDRIRNEATPDACVKKGVPMTELVDQLRTLLAQNPYDLLRVQLRPVALDLAVSAFDSWVTMNVRILEALARGDDLVKDGLCGAALDDLQALVGLHAHLGQSLQAAARSSEPEVVLVLHVMRTRAAAARRALIAIGEHMDEFFAAWGYDPPEGTVSALTEMRERLADALPISSADDTDDSDATRVAGAGQAIPVTETGEPVRQTSRS
ncbi:MAG: response regulator transcription factor [Candidatus Dormibacteria bacterium]